MHRTLGPVGKARDQTHRTRRTANHRNQVTAAHRAGRYNDPNRREILREHATARASKRSRAPLQHRGRRHRSGKIRDRPVAPQQGKQRRPRPPDRPITGQAPLRDTGRFPVDHPREGVRQRCLVDPDPRAPLAGQGTAGSPPAPAVFCRAGGTPRWRSSSPGTSEPRLGPSAERRSHVALANRFTRVRREIP
jgi:hypothetical protein